MKKRYQSGTPGQAHDKFKLNGALSKIEADYYAHRSKEHPVHFKCREEKLQNKRTAIRSIKSNLDAKTVANIRWLRESLGWTCKKIAIKYGMTESRACKLCDYCTWAEVMPSSEGLDLEALQTSKQKE